MYMYIVLVVLFIESMRMKKSFIFNIFTVVLVLFVFAAQSFAKTENNIIQKIVINSPINSSYSLDLLFDKSYKGSAFIQKREPGSYYVFLPETSLNGKKPKIIFKNKYDKSKINIDFVEKPYVKDKKTSNYVRINVDMADDYSIKLISGLASDYKINFIQSNNLDIFSVIIFAIIGIALFLSLKVIRQCRKQEQINYRPSRSYAYLKAQTEYLEEMKKASEQKVQRAILPKSSIRNSIKQADKKSFDCFELPYAEDMQTPNNYEFKSTLKQASKLLKEKPSLVKLRHTNPITKTNSTDASGLQMPAVEDVVQKRTSAASTTSQKQTNAELLSVLNITPSKGFYLTTVEDTLALFGFINENVFLFQKFKDLSQINLQARFYDRNGKNDIYIVRLDNYKAMIEISDTSMKELAKI